MKTLLLTLLMITGTVFAHDTCELPQPTAITFEDVINEDKEKEEDTYVPTQADHLKKGDLVEANGIIGRVFAIYKLKQGNELRTTVLIKTEKNVFHSFDVTQHKINVLVK